MTEAVPRLSRTVPDWHDEGAACRLFPELVNAWHDARKNSAQAAAARIICAACPVRQVCARDALERGEAYGMWGGLDREDRKAVAAEFGFPKPSSLPEHGTNARYAKHRCGCADCKRAHTVYEADRRLRVARVGLRRVPRHSAPAVTLSAITVCGPLDRSAYRRRTRRRTKRR